MVSKIQVLKYENNIILNGDKSKDNLEAELDVSRMTVLNE